MPLPRELWDDVVPESTTVVGDIDTFLVYVEHGDAWRDWCGRVRRCLRWMAEDVGMVSPDVVERLLARPCPRAGSKPLAGTTQCSP